YIYQDDGKQRDIIPLLVEVGVDVIAGLQPPEVGDVELSKAKRLCRDRVALMGGLDPCYTFDRGTPEGVRQAVRQAIEDGGAGGGYVLATAEAVAPETPAGCLRAAVQAVKDFGVYGRTL
ncbi:MAG: uroporphyrinogen decarboxylase family protein, partial [Candidatus Latescibacteria bacterium]|nr:uroporphyrinogen decarboxylase family protein [Candidatus Latescibacterota bacterium]